MKRHHSGRIIPSGFMSSARFYANAAREPPELGGITLQFPDRDQNSMLRTYEL
jgi:hypothetical protein